MKTIALRFGEHFSPDCGTIAAHQEIIGKLGYVWYGKMGSSIARQVVNEILKNEDARILLIQSGGIKRYWAHVSEVTNQTPPLNAIPEYYRDLAEKFKIWFKVTEFEPAPKDIMSQCRVVSSGNKLNIVSRNSMSPYFKIEY